MSRRRTYPPGWHKRRQLLIWKAIAWSAIIVFTLESILVMLISSGVILTGGAPLKHGLEANALATIREEALEESIPDSCSLKDVLCGDEKILDDIAYCESRHNYHATTPLSSAYGKYQIINATWQDIEKHLGIKLDKMNPNDQELAGKTLYAMRGTTPWKESESCWKKLASKK